MVQTELYEACTCTYYVGSCYASGLYECVLYVTCIPKVYFKHNSSCSLQLRYHIAGIFRHFVQFISSDECRKLNCPKIMPPHSDQRHCLVHADTPILHKLKRPICSCRHGIHEHNTRSQSSPCSCVRVDARYSI